MPLYYVITYVLSACPCTYYKLSLEFITNNFLRELTCAYLVD